jgi:uncharacterized peroxidase-related enzyme
MSRIKSLPENPTLLDLRSKYSDLFDLLRPYGQQLMRGPSPLSSGERELIAAYTSGLNSCRYCHGVHAKVAEGFGIDEAVFEALFYDLESASIENRLKPLLAYVRKLTQTPSKLTDGDAEAVYSAGWSDEALVHTIAVCAYFNQMNRLVEGSGIVGSPESYANAARNLISAGYQR